jgi:phage terminase large subunit GpA-like protein
MLIAALRLLKPPPALSIWAWGELRRRMGKNVTARPGRYRVSTTPYQLEPQESFTAPDVQTTVLYWAKRLGKTEMINNLHGSVVEQAPRNILHVLPTLDSAKKWSKQFFTPMVRSTPVLRALIKEGRSRDANNTILAKEFPGGTISAIGANSPSGFRQVQAPVVTCDEIDAMEDGAEGDPVTLAFGRAENYPDSIQVVSSTATRLLVKPKDGEICNTGSRIHDWWLKSDQRKWFVPCGCGKWHVLMWSGVKWPEGNKHEDAWYETPCCGAKWDDYMRVAAVLAGEWRPTAPFRGIRGYWLNGLNTTFSPKKGYKSKLHQFASEFYEAYTSGEAARITWKNTFLCEPHEEVIERVESAPLLDRREPYTPTSLPVGIGLVGCAVDVQKDRLEYELIGLGLNDETWGIEYGKHFGNPEKEEVWADLKGTLSREFARVDGVKLKVAFTAIDHRHFGSMVRKFAIGGGFARVYPVYGVPGKQSLLVRSHPNKHYRMNLYSVNTEAAKDVLFARLRLMAPGPRYMHYPLGFGYDEETGYFDQLTAEEVRIKYTQGFAQRYYWKDPNRRNEAIDLRVYFLAGLDILKPVMPAILHALMPQKPPEPVGTDHPVIDGAALAPPKPKPAPFVSYPKKGFVNGWK